MSTKNTGINRQGYIILIILGLIFGIITLLKVLTPSTSLYHFFIRLFALWGYAALAIATIMTPFLKEITKIFGKPFIKIHHLCAYTGVIFITLHPVLSAIQTMDLTVFLPNFDSWIQFWTLAGRPALILLYIGLIGVLLRKKIKSWRIIHILMYPMLLMGFIHGFLYGTDFANVGIMIIFSILFGLAMVSFIVKRLQRYKLQQKQKKY